jgi:hypothetical protein
MMVVFRDSWGRVYRIELPEMVSFTLFLIDNGSPSAAADELSDHLLPEMSSPLTENARMQGLPRLSIVLPVMRIFFA